VKRGDFNLIANLSVYGKTYNKNFRGIFANIEGVLRISEINKTRAINWGVRHIWSETRLLI
jgi:hypothetical protein